MDQIIFPTTEITHTGQSISLSSLSRRDLFNRDEADSFFMTVFFTLFEGDDEGEQSDEYYEKIDQQYHQYSNYAEKNFTQAYQQALEKAFQIIQKADINSRLLSDVLSLFPTQLALAKMVAQHPSCSNDLLVRMLHWLPEAAEQNPKLSKPDYQTEAWQQRVESAKPGNAKPPKYADAGVLYEEVDSEKPELFKVLYYLEQGADKDRAYVLGLQGIPVELCQDYLTSRNANIRKALANRKTLPEAGFETLAKDKAKTIRLTLANNPATSPEALAILSEDALKEIADIAIAHPLCPEQAIHQTRLKQAQQPALHETGTEHLKPEEIRQLLFDTQTSSAVLEQLASHEAAWIRYACGIHSNTPPQVLEQLAADDEQWVCESVAFNPHTAPTTLETLAQLDILSMQIALASNPATPEPVQFKLAESANNKVLLALINQTELESVWHKVLEVCKTKGDKKAKWQAYLTKGLNPESKAGPLRTLSRGADSRHLFVQRMIARHPNCPPSLKGQFAQYLYSDLVQNPSIALKLLENPQAITPETCADWIIKEWGANANMPGHVSRFFLQGDDSKLARNAIDAWSSQVRDQQRWVLSADIHVRKRIANKCKPNRFMYEALIHDPKESVRELIAKKKIPFPSVRQQLLKDKSTLVRAALAQNKSAGKTGEAQETLLEVANKGPKRQRIKLAKEATDSNILDQFVTDRDAEVHLAVAHNHHTRAQSLEQLAQAQDETLLKAIANHHNTPIDSLVKLSQHSNEAIRHTVAQHKNTPTDTLARLSEDSSDEVRRTVVRHPQLPESVNRKLLDDVSASVRYSALRQYEYNRGKKPFPDQSLLSKMSQDSNISIRALVAEYTQDLAIQKQYSVDDNSQVRKALAKNQQLDKAIAMILARDTATDVVQELACYSRHIAVLTELTHHPAGDIATYVGYNTMFNKKKRLAFAEQLLTMAHEGALLAAIHIYVIANRQPNLNLLLQLAKSQYKNVRESLSALHEEKPLPTAVIDCLLQNPTPQIAESGYKLDDEQIRRLVDNADVETRRTLAEYTDNKALLLKLAENTDAQVRQHIAENESSNAKIRAKLNATACSATQDVKCAV